MPDYARDTVHYQRKRFTLALRALGHGFLDAIGAFKLLNLQLSAFRHIMDEVELEAWADEMNAEANCVVCINSPTLPPLDHIHEPWED